MKNECPCCLLEGIEYINTKRIKQEISDSQAAVECEVSLRKWLIHIETHVRKPFISALAQNIEPTTVVFLNKVELVRQSVERIEEVVKDVHKKIIDNPKEFDHKLIASWTSLEKTLVENVKSLALLSGDIVQGTQINIQQNIIKADAIMAIVMEEATDEMKSKILQKLKLLKVDKVKDIEKAVVLEEKTIFA